MHPNFLDQLSIFVAVAEQGSFNAAARSLGRAQSAISYAIANLEAMLRLSLFERAGRRGGLTAAGRNLLPQARQVIAEAETLLANAGQIAAGTEPFLRLLIDEMFPFDRLAAALQDTQDRFRATKLRIDQAPLRDVAAGLNNGDCDLGFTLDGPTAAEHGLETMPLGSLTLLAVAAPHHPLASTAGPVPKNTAQRHRQIVLSERLEHSDDRGGGIVAAETWRVGDLRLKHDLLLAGLGWGAMPADMVAADIAAGRLSQLHLAFADDPVLRLTAIWRRAVPLGPVARSLLDRLCPAVAS